MDAIVRLWVVVFPVALILFGGIAARAFAAGEAIVLLGRLTPSARPERVPDGWKPLVFKKIPATTSYSIVADGTGFVLKAESQAAASGLYRPVDLAPTAYPLLSWRWKVENVLANGDERRKDGDDYAARIYVAFQYAPDTATLWEKTRYGTYKLLYGEYPPKAVINYIWANRLAKDAAIDNAFTDRAKMIAVRSGPEEIGRWIREERNLYEDYRRLFGQEPPRIAGIALMTDTDNTGGSAVAYYDEITLRPGR
jgi:hypothetical protein